MSEVDPRFPNRKKPPLEPPGFGKPIADTDQQKPDEEVSPVPLNTYKIIGETHAKPKLELKEEKQPATIDVIAEAEVPAPGVETPAPRTSRYAVVLARVQKFAESPRRLYITLGAGIAFLLVITLANFFWPGAPDGPYDLESVTSDAVGLKGHLYTKWDKQLQYRLTLAPSDPDQLAGFSLVAANPPRPFSINIQLKDNQGFVLCSREIVLKFDARKAAALAATYQAGNTDAANLPADQQAPVVDFARLDAQEAAREQGKDIFWNQYGPDGQVAAINAQGVIPCAKKFYQVTTFWSFVPNFPTLAEQSELLKRQEELQADAALPPVTQPPPVIRKRAVSKASPKLLTYSVEGDDAIEEFDVSHGILETRGRKTFYFDKASVAVNDSGWQDYPVSIHYKCDQNASCLVSHSGLGALRARLRR